MGFKLMSRFIAHFDTACDCTIQFTLTHTLVSTDPSSLSLLGSAFQRRTLRFLWVPELSSASATSVSQQRNPSGSLTVCNSKSESKLCYHRRSVGQSVLVPIPYLEPKTRFLLLSIYNFTCRHSTWSVLKSPIPCKHLLFTALNVTLVYMYVHYIQGSAQLLMR
jgi:hypothetical protein